MDDGVLRQLDRVGNRHKQLMDECPPDFRETLDEYLCSIDFEIGRAIGCIDDAYEILRYLSHEML